MDQATETALQHLETKLNNIQQKYVPVSEERLNKLWGAVRGTVDEFTLQLVDFQEQRTSQNEAIATLTAKVENLTQQVMLLTATAPQDTSESVNDIGMRLAVLETANVGSDN